MVLVFMISFVWCRNSVLVCFMLGPVGSLRQYLVLPGPGHCVAQASAQGSVSQAVPCNPSASPKVFLIVLQWWPREAGWGHRPGLCGERDTVWAGHGVPRPSLPPRRGLQLQHLPGHHRQPDLFRTRCMFLHSSTLFAGFPEYLALCSLLAGPFRKCDSRSHKTGEVFEKGKGRRPISKYNAFQSKHLKQWVIVSMC